MKELTMMMMAGVMAVQSCGAQQTAVQKPKIESSFLVSAELKQKMSADELKESYASLKAFVKNGYSAYRILYNTTTYDGSKAVASGALFIPDAAGAAPILNYNHGTIFPSQESSAPSYFSYSAESAISKLFAANGYVVAMPDYVGYGSTKNIAHPYGAYDVIAQSSVDMLEAVAEFVKKENITVSGKYFYSGWSEGAAVGMATVKKLEEKYPGKFVPAAGVFNAGPYYSSGFANKVIDENEELQYMPSYAWVLTSYNKIYDINKPSSYYFTAPSAGKLKTGVSNDIERNPSELFTKTFAENFKAGRDTGLMNAFYANDLWNWVPKTKLILCHGDRDEYVPVFNSEKAAEYMKSKGAPVELKIFKGQTHSSGALGFLQAAFTEFESKR